MLRALFLGTVLAVVALQVAPARADDVHEIRARDPRAEAAETAQALTVAPENRAAWALQRRGRLMLAFGIASVLSSAVYLIWASQTSACPRDDPGLRDGDILAGGLLGGIGAGLTIGGSVAIALGARRAKKPADEREKTRAVLFSILTMGVTQTGFAIGRIAANGFCPT